jgi:25S rRNA (cytosine2278-C5)-methyltransferase
LPDVASLMSLYYDAVTVLTGEEQRGSLKSRIYGSTSGLKSKPAHLYALISECAKYDTFLREVIEKSQILEHEPKVSRGHIESTRRR